MAFKAKTKTSENVKNEADLPAPHVSETALGGASAEVFDRRLSPAPTLNPCNDSRSTQNPHGIVANGKDEVMKLSTTCSSEQKTPDSAEPSQTGLNLGGQKPQQTLGIGVSLLGEIYTSATATATTFLPRVTTSDAHAVSDEVNTALVQAVQLRWGCQRVRSVVSVDNWRGAPQDVQERIVGQVQVAPGQEAMFAADVFAADVVFLGWLLDASIECERLALEGSVAYLLDRYFTRARALGPHFRALAAELDGHRAAFAKAEAIADGAGWPADKQAVADARLRYLVDRIAILSEVLARFRQDLFAHAVPVQEAA